jgi:hypothetical protein
MKDWNHWLRASADKILLLLAAGGFLIYAAHFAHRGADPQLQHDALSFAGQAFAGFLALTQAGRMASALGAQPAQPDDKKAIE